MLKIQHRTPGLPPLATAENAGAAEAQALFLDATRAALTKLAEGLGKDNAAATLARLARFSEASASAAQALDFEDARGVAQSGRRKGLNPYADSYGGDIGYDAPLPMMGSGPGGDRETMGVKLITQMATALRPPGGDPLSVALRQLGTAKEAAAGETVITELQRRVDELIKLPVEAPPDSRTFQRELGQFADMQEGMGVMVGPALYDSGLLADPETGAIYQEEGA